MSSGGGGTSTNTVQNTNAFIPDWLSSYTQQAVSRASDLSNQAYDPYTGQSVAAPDPAQLQAYNQIGGMQGFGVGAFGQNVNDLQRLSGQLAPLTPDQIQANTDQLYSSYQGNVYNPAAGLLGNFASQGPATAAGVGANAQALMSPYTGAVLDPAMQTIQQQLAQNLQTIGAGANQAGAFGGSRQGVMEGVAQANAAMQAGKYQGDLLNNQWGQALQAGGNIALQGAQQGLSANTALANLISGGYGQQQQLGANIADTNLRQGMAAAGQIPVAITGMQNLMLGQSNALNQAGSLQQQYQQNLLNAAQGAWAQQQAFPYQQLQTLLGAISGIPYSTSNTMFSQDFMSPPQANPYGQAIGGGAALAGGIGSLLNSTNFGGNA